MVHEGHGGKAMNSVTLKTLQSIVGAVVTSVGRVFYVYQGETNTEVGALVFEFADGRHMRIDSGPDGEALKVVARRWEDPFREDQMTPENRRFVELSGKWTAVDVSRNPGYVEIIGGVITDVTPVLAFGGKIIGAIFETSKGVLRTDVEADDLYVQVG